MTATIRAMRWWDVEPAVALEARLFPDPWTAAMFWSELAGAPGTRTYYAAVEGERLIGYAGLSAAGTDADVLTVAVAPEAQGGGLGSRLVDALLDDAARRDCSRVTLEVRADNDPAQRLYARHGFERIATRRGYYPPDGTDAIVMQLRLDARARAARLAALSTEVGV